MSRTAIYTALVLRNRPSGESNSEITLLTAEEGIVRTTVFGGPKSKMRSAAAPYNSGKAWIYRDPAKDYGKLSDFDIHSWRPGLRELYERTMAAGAISQTILSSHGGGGDWASAMKLAESALDALENANEELCSRLFVHFLWRWSGFLGIQPHLECCAAGDNFTSPLWFSLRENNALCGNCVPSDKTGHIQLNPGCCKWFSAVEELDPSYLHRYSMDKRSFDEAKLLVTSVMTGALGKRLSSWEW